MEGGRVASGSVWRGGRVRRHQGLTRVLHKFCIHCPTQSIISALSIDVNARIRGRNEWTIPNSELSLDDRGDPKERTGLCCLD